MILRVLSTHSHISTHEHAGTSTQRLIYSHSLTHKWGHTQTYLHIHWLKCAHTYSYHLPRCQVHTLTWMIIDTCTCILTQSHIHHAHMLSNTVTHTQSLTHRYAYIHSSPLAHECTPTDNHSHMNTLMHSVAHKSTFLHSYTQMNMLKLTCLDVQTCTLIQSQLDILTSNQDAHTVM